jgi:hypothetical protein
MITRYKNFIKEKLEQSSIGEWVESLIHDEYIMSVVNRHIEDVDPSIRVANAVNILPKPEKTQLVNTIKKYLDEGLSDEQIDVSTTININKLTNESQSQVVGVGDLNNELNFSKSGKWVFASFLKSITALGAKDYEINKKEEKLPDNFLISYLTKDLEKVDVLSVFNRFKSLSPLEKYINGIPYTNICLYITIRVDATLEYGIWYGDYLPIGEFKLSNSNIKWIMNIESKSSIKLKSILKNLSYKDLLTIGSIKVDMKSYTPGYFEKVLNPILEDRVISFGYYGVGKWSDGKIDSGELINIKNNITNWILGKKWGDKILIGINPKSFWLWIHFKLK